MRGEFLYMLGFILKVIGGITVGSLIISFFQAIAIEKERREQEIKKLTQLMQRINDKLDKEHYKF